MNFICGNHKLEIIFFRLRLGLGLGLSYSLVETGVPHVQMQCKTKLKLQTAFLHPPIWNKLLAERSQVVENWQRPALAANMNYRRF